MANFDKLSEIASAFDKKLEAYNKKLFEGKDAEVQGLKELREKYNTLKTDAERTAAVNEIKEKYSEILELEKESSDFIDKLLDEDTEIELELVERDDFIEGCAKADYNITPVSLKELKPMFKTK